MQESNTNAFNQYAVRKLTSFQRNYYRENPTRSISFSNRMLRNRLETATVKLRSMSVGAMTSDGRTHYTSSLKASAGRTNFRPNSGQIQAKFRKVQDTTTAWGEISQVLSRVKPNAYTQRTQFPFVLALSLWSPLTHHRIIHGGTEPSQTWAL